MTIRKWLCTFGALSSIVGTAVATPPMPILRYTFNTVGSTQTSIGTDQLALSTYKDIAPADLVTGSPTGPSGMNGDQSLNLGAISSTYSSAVGTVPNGDSLQNSLSAFSISAWVNNTTPTASKLLEYVFDMSASGANSITFGLQNVTSDNGSADDEYVKVGSSGGVSAPTPLPAVANQWTFIGVTVDAQGNVTFYSSSTTTPGTLVNESGNSNRGSVNSDNTLVGIGDNGIGIQFQLQGAVDDVQLFGSALSVSDMSTVYSSDMPEPSCLVLAALGLLSLRRSTWRQSAW